MPNWSHLLTPYLKILPLITALLGARLLCMLGWFVNHPAIHATVVLSKEGAKVPSHKGYIWPILIIRPGHHNLLHLCTIFGAEPAVVALSLSGSVPRRVD